MWQRYHEKALMSKGGRDRPWFTVLAASARPLSLSLLSASWAPLAWSILLALLLCLPSLGSLGLSPGSLSPGTSYCSLEIPHHLCVCEGLSDTHLQPLLSSRISFLSFYWGSPLGRITTSNLGVLLDPSLSSVRASNPPESPAKSVSKSIKNPPFLPSPPFYYGAIISYLGNVIRSSRPPSKPPYTVELQ